ncbi:hypothetical protein V8C35DRAFT_294695 [Trichoderma chlorosporum]
MIATAGLETPITSDVFSLESPSAVEQLLSADEPKLQDVVYALVRGKAHSSLFDEVEPDSPLHAYLSKSADKLVRINVTLLGSDLTVVYPPSYWLRLKNQPEAIQRIAENTKALLSSIEFDQQVTLGLVFAATDDWEARWSHFCGKDHRRSAYSQLVPNVRNGQIDDLDFDSINLFAIDRDGPKDRASAAFLTKDERTIKLIGAAADEAAWQQTLADKCAQKLFNAYLLPVPGSEWNRIADKKKDDYGVEPTKQPTAYFMSVPLDENREFVPDVGTKVQVHLKVTQRFHDVPDHKLSDRQVQSRAAALQNGLGEAESKAYNTQVAAQRRLEKIIAEDASDEDITHQRHKVDTVRDSKYTDVATEKIWSFVTSISSDAKERFTEEEADLRK